MDKSLSEQKLDFVMSVYESINKQIQSTDLKTSVIISWDSVIAIMLGREIGQMVKGDFVNVFTVVIASLCVLFLGFSGIFIFGTLKPRTRVSKRREFVGLLYTGDVSRLAKTSSGRIDRYLQALMHIEKDEGLYEQFVNSIVLISDIQNMKNKSFMYALGFTAVSFGFLVALIGIVAVRLGLLNGRI